MPFGNSGLESQRDSIVQPRVATKELPWVNAPTMTYPNGGMALRYGPKLWSKTTCDDAVAVAVGAKYL
jgi:hypothetical protein